jgi:dihydroorotate dehydrogenase
MKPWLWMPASLAHTLAPLALELHALVSDRTSYEWQKFEWRGLKFDNRLGIAGGVDKDASHVEQWWTYGPGFIEVGTITPRAQGPNPGKIMARDNSSQALWNRMGFPGSGAWVARENLNDLKYSRHTPVFVNIGKNRSTPNEEAARDYAECIGILGELADAFVVNISSPNTTGLRELLEPQNLTRFLEGVLSARNTSVAPKTPVLLKVSPDIEDREFRRVIEIAKGAGIDGFIATNTTLARESGSPFPAEGGVSGAPLAQRSKDVLKLMVDVLGPNRSDTLLVSCGGVMSPEDVFERLELGADLVEVYTALIFQGPWFFRDVAQAAKNRMQKQKPMRS